MPMARILFIPSVFLLSTFVGCATTRGPGDLDLRSDGSPVPAPCSEKSLEVMRYLKVRVGDAALIQLDANQMSAQPVTLYDGPVESVLVDNLGTLDSPSRLYGWIWTGGPQIVVRYYEAHPMDGDKVPVCAVARLGKGQMRKRPESTPGTAIVEHNMATAFIVDSYR